jgi:putative phage-type endonuclease
MIEQGTPEWHEQRRGHATASRASDILAELKSGEAASRKNYRTELIVERLTGRVSDDKFITDAMKHGTDTEPLARSWYCNTRGVLVTQLGFELHPTIKWVGASVDSEVEEGVGGIEIKCPNTAQHISALINGMDPKHIPQVQFQMWVMGWQWVDFISFDDRLPEKMWGYVQRVNRDDVYIKALEEKVVKFLNEVQETIDKLEAL